VRIRDSFIEQRGWQVNGCNRISPKIMPSWTKECAVEFSDMVALADRGEPPMRDSHWLKVVLSEGRKIGPGW
jgi:hypothetical protein